MKLLIADDQNSVHLFIDQMIDYEKVGITQVFHVKNGQEALECVLQEYPEIILLDIRMPVMDGLTFLENIETLNFEHRVLILSAYDEFEYARKCIVYGVQEYFLKPIDTKELLSALEKNVAELREQKQRKLENIITEYINTGKEDPENIPQDFAKGFYGAVLVKKGDSMDFRLENEKEMFVISANEVNVYFFHFQDNMDIYLFFERHKMQEPEISVGFSRIHTGCEEFFGCIQEGLEAILQGFYEPGIYLYQKHWKKQNVQYKFEDITEQLKESYDRGDVQEMKEVVDKLFFVFQRANVPPKAVQEYCYGFLIRVNSDFMKTLSTLKGSSLATEFSFSDASGLKGTFLRMLLSMKLEIAPEEVQTDIDVVKRIRQYIDTNYEKEISLGILSKHFFISKYQISRLFKKQYGVNFSDYILQVRMDASLMLLKNSTEKLENIAQKVGFEDTSYFSRVFSRFFGITPGEYRRKNKGDLYE